MVICAWFQSQTHSSSQMILKDKARKVIIIKILKIAPQSVVSNIIFC